jgi:hypothetical protein
LLGVILNVLVVICIKDCVVIVNGILLMKD